MKETESAYLKKSKFSIEVSLGRYERILILILPFVALSILAFLFFHNPIKTSILPKCIWLEYTGLYCPGCGGTRATYYLIHGNIIRAFDYNPLFISILPFMLYLCIISLGIKINGKPVFKVPRLSLNFCIMIGVIIIAFCILRNIPVYPFNYLAP